MDIVRRGIVTKRLHLFFWRSYCKNRDRADQKVVEKVLAFIVTCGLGAGLILLIKNAGGGHSGGIHMRGTAPRPDD